MSDSARPPSVIVVGAGVAGTSAALAAARAGARVTLVDGGPGASSLWTGAVDGVEPSPEARSVAEALGIRLATSTVATTLGWVRPAAGHELGLLDLGSIDAAAIAVPTMGRAGWDARAVARAAGLRPLDASLLRHTDERALPDADFAARHDDGERLAWLAQRLREALDRAGSGVRAVLLPPSLGVERERATALGELVGLPSGEALGAPGGPAGLRFERARDRALALAGVTVVPGRAASVSHGEPGWRVSLGEGALDADAVVLAIGGLIGGGLAYDPSEARPAAELPAEARPPFRFTIDAPLRLGARGRPLGAPGSLFGVPPESLAWPLARDPLIGRVGALADREGRVGSGLYVAGELVADAPRTWLEAVESGARAGGAAAGGAGAPGLSLQT